MHHNVADAGHAREVAGGRLWTDFRRNQGPRNSLQLGSTALNQLTMCLANELRPENFCCVSVHPGWVRTDMGGPKAPMLPPDSARHLIALADRLTPGDSGKFLNYDGATMQW